MKKNIFSDLVQKTTRSAHLDYNVQINARQIQVFSKKFFGKVLSVQTTEAEDQEIRDLLGNPDKLMDLLANAQPLSDWESSRKLLKKRIWRMRKRQVASKRKNRNKKKKADTGKRLQIPVKKRNIVELYHNLDSSPRLLICFMILRDRKLCKLVEIRLCCYQNEIESKLR